MNYQHWKLDIKDRIARLVLNRPNEKNRIGDITLRELKEIATLLQTNPEVWVIILSAEGEHFSTGADVSLIGEMIGKDYQTYASNLRASQSVLDTFEAIGKPVIAVLQGYVIGAGILLSLCCDFRIAAGDASFALPEVKRSIAVLMGTQRITRTIGPAHTKELVMLGDPVSAKRAYEMGLVNEVVDKSELSSRAEAIALKFLNLPPLAVGICKKIINEGQFLDRAGQDLEILAQGELLNSDDFKEAIDSFFAKRKPVYRGR